ncbi:MAG: polysaccharide pyruvyl transferase family protein [Cycloclasticus sp.]
MRIILINDTSSNDHVGCNLVVKNTLRICNEIGLNIVKTIHNNAESTLNELKKSTDFDCLLINGEGTMHHDRRLAIEFGECAKWCKSKNKLVVLYNTVWQENITLNNYLQFFDLIYCRESLSADLIQKEGYLAKVVPDLVFASIGLPKFAPPKDQSNIIVLDAVRKELTRKLGWFAGINKYSFLVMSGNNAKYIKQRFFLSIFLRVFGSYKDDVSNDEFIAKLSRATKVISGRFHGTCLALMLGKQTASISSNTHKIEGLYKDIGLDQNVIMKNDRLRKELIDSQWIECKKNMNLIQRYTETAPQKIQKMFKEIKSLEKRVV